MRSPERTTDLDKLVRGHLFTWGSVIKIHTIGEYSFIEYHPWKCEKGDVLVGTIYESATYFHIYISGRDTCNDATSLDDAMVMAIAFKHDGPNSQAAGFFMKMIKNGER
jgi:hypothetical protein